MTDNQPGWQPDPTGRFEHRYWDGSRWTDNVANAGVAATDPYDAGAGVDAGTDATAAGAPAEGEPTWVQPAPPTTPAWGPPPAPAPPGPPVAPGAAGAAAAGSKKGLLIGGGILAAIAAAVVAFLLLGGDDDDGGGDLRSELASMMLEDGDLSEAQAECLADAIVDDIGEERFEGLDLSADEPPPEIADDFFNSVMGNLEDCDIDLSSFTGDSGDEDTTEGDDSATGGSALIDAFAEGLQAESDLTDAQATCLANAIVDDVGADVFVGLDFTADEPPAELLTALFDNLEECGIELADLGGFGSDGGDGGGDGEGTYGSDPELDALYDQCEAGDYQACDDLYNESPFDSEYEEFGDTCGNRNDPAGYCVDIYGDG